MSTTEIIACPKCQRPVPADAPHGLCPVCLSATLGTGRQTANDTTFALEFGPYELLDEIGRGGAGVVFRARDRRTQALVALKILTSGRFASPAERDRFAREAQAVANLRHPGIVPFLDVGEEDGQPYLAMRWIDGQSLVDRTRRGLPPLREAVEMIRQVAEAVHHAHERGIIHRDLKPSNILITPAGEVCVVDFGLARHLEQDVTVTRSGEALGTPGFMPPEQCGQKQATPGPAADVYSLGSVLYFALTGRPPFLAGTHHETIAQLLQDEPVPPRRLNPAIPRDLESICLKCLEKEPSKRYASGAAFAEDLERFLKDEPIQARPIGPTAKAWRWCRRNRTVSVSAVLIVALVAGFSWHNWRTVTELRNTAPSLIALAESLVTAQKFPEALEQVDVALRLQPRNADYLNLKGTILLGQLRLGEARELFIRALSLDASHAPASERLALCEKLLTSRIGQSEWTTDALIELYRGLVQQGRSAEAYAVSKHIDAAETRFVATLQDRLTRAGITNQLHWTEHRPAGLREATDRGANRATLRDTTFLALSFAASGIADLSPLKGIPLQELTLTDCTNVADLSPLRGMPLTHFTFTWNKVTDLSPLSDMPLEFLYFAFNRVSDLSPLRKITSLRSLTFHNVDVADLEPLRQLPLEHLAVGSIRATSLEPLRGMPLTFLGFHYVKINDLGPVASMPLQELRIRQAPVSDLSPLRGLPLRVLHLMNCSLITDLSPLRSCPTLEQLVLPPNANDIEFLRHLPHLREISCTEQPLAAAEFWKAYDARH
jgi:serine/threonine protein kinase